MALQGSIETFALPDVMRLLASTKKTGRLRLTGTRGSGSVWVADGQVVAVDAESRRADGTVDVLFELLRLPDGEFVFDADVLPERLSPPEEVEPVLAQAETRLAEWREIEAVVPSSRSWVTLNPTLGVDDVTIDADAWAMIVRVGHGTSVDALGDQFDLSELDVARKVRDLVDQGLVEVGGEAPDAFVIERRSGRAPDGQPHPERADVAGHHDDVDEAVVGGVGLATVDPVEAEPMVDAVVAEAGGEVGPFGQDVLGPADEALDGAPVPVGIDDPSEAAEVARQLANLSPKAAKAVAAAAKAATAEERERALAEVDDSEDVNRDILIRFLGSVNG